MAYFIFRNNLDGIEGTLYKIAENQNDLNNLNFFQSDFKIIEESQSNFDLVKYASKKAIKYNNNSISFIDNTISFLDEEQLKNRIKNLKNLIQNFLDNNKNNPSFNVWSDYFNQLNSLNTSNISYPLNKSLEQYFKDQNQISLNILQLP